jgi:TRAP-type mannitol/chloroaromatic compound transport system permease small subunit
MLIKIVQFIDKFTDFVGKMTSWLVVPLTLFVVLEVILRKVFNNPTIWSFELSIFLYGAHFMLAASYGLLHKSHVNVTLIVDKLFSKKTAVIIDLISYILLLIPFVVMMIIFGTGFAAKSWAQLETSWSVWHPPLYPIKTVIPITAVLIMIQAISEILKKILFIISGDERWTH